ncbi:dsRBD fold-containing protein [Cellulomonas sp. ICMP 17802]|uniref:dsRBD fold-containing protein n=1 Tax=Cellulomonas sp. ICMP 17802 TaxID=3239199 RepID=UPI00351B9858
MARTWKAAIYLFDADDPRSDSDVTTAHAVLETVGGTTVEGYGRARRAPADVDVPEIGDELAAARALRDLADKLLRATSDDISQIEHAEVHLVR